MNSTNNLQDLYDSARNISYARFLSDMYFLMAEVSENRSLATEMANAIYDSFIADKRCIECCTNEEMVLDMFIFDGEERYNLVCPACGVEYELD